MQRTNQGGKGVHQALYERMERATEPVVLLAYPGVHPSKLQGVEIMPGIFALITLVVTVITYIDLPRSRFVALIPLLLTVLLVFAVFSSRRNAKQRAILTAQMHLGDGKDALVQAIQQFQAATTVPVRIVLRDDTPTTDSATLQLFEQCERERVLDPRGLLFVLSAKTGGYAIALGPKLANKKPSIGSFLFKTAKLSTIQCSDGLIACLQTLRPELHRLFPQHEDPSRLAADSLDVQPSQGQVSPPGG
ncbi:hypothetical protein [Hyalangium sp.]|uniref:hypothetical protein n=1 Tax=Hyalangium sp. TaxID=2028555 RepID=UPI002D3D6ED5|nr:hypothetical protein [Hyalangium sp.]HYH97643.1 hypothetical protein [Hyalangium sp.]